MSGSQLVQLLDQLGYEGALQLDGASLDWMFEHKTVLPFLEWVCEEVQPSNVINPSELSKFEELEQEEGVLEGEQLEEALQNASCLDGQQLAEDKLKEEIKHMEEEMKLCKQRKDTLIHHRNKLSLHQTVLADRLSKMDSVENAAKAEYKLALEQNQADNTKINSRLSSMMCAVNEMMGLYQAGASGTEDSMCPQDAVFLSQLDLDNYYKMEDRFTRELTAFTKKQFFDGIAQMAGETEGSQYEFLEINNPDSLLLKGEREDVILDDCKELARLQATYPRSEANLINGKVKSACTQTGCEFLEQKAETLKEKPYPSDMKNLSNKLKDEQNILSMVRRDLSTLSEDEIPALIKENATSQVTKILRGDYNLKIARQDYFIGNQDRVINQLVIQRARNEFFTMAYEMELRNHRETHRLLTAASILLQKSLSAHKRRMKMMKEPQLTTARHQRSTVDSRDKAVCRIHQLLDQEGESSEKPHLFVTYAQLGENAERLGHQVSSLSSSLATATSSQDSRLTMLESSVGKCEQLVYHGSSTTGGQPVLNPQPIMDALTQLDSMLRKLEQAVMDVIKDIDNKKRILKTDRLQATERQLFVHFFNNPDRLRRAIEEVTSRLHAQVASK